jgi:hypothetical protein
MATDSSRNSSNNNSQYDLDRQDKVCRKARGKGNLDWVPMVNLYLKTSLPANNRSSMLWRQQLLRTDKDKDNRRQAALFDPFLSRPKERQFSKVSSEFRCNKCSKWRLRCSRRKWSKRVLSKLKINEPRRQAMVHLSLNLVIILPRHHTKGWPT